MADDLLLDAEALRVSTLASLDTQQQTHLGQFFTPSAASVLMAGLPRVPDRGGPLSVLDPGAGSGILMAALVKRIVEDSPGTPIHVTAIEVDETVVPALRATADLCVDWARGHGTAVTVNVRCEDLIYASTGPDAGGLAETSDFVIMNPPYAKLAANSVHRRMLAMAGVDAPNLYAAFLALGVLSLRHGGQLVAITPRSFANGPYFERFRRFLLDAVAVDRLHTFESRSTVFSDTGVLQENIVFSATKGGEQGKVKITSCRGHLDKATEYVVDYPELVRPDDPHRFLRIPGGDAEAADAKVVLAMPCRPSDLGLSVSTGRVVDFRVRENLQRAGARPRATDLSGEPAARPGGVAPLLP